MLEPAEVRSLLFARAVVLCEGQTEIGALPRWWRNARTGGLPDPGAASIAFTSVYGHSGYGRYIRFLDAYAIPWVIIADGPALRMGQKLPLDMREYGHWPLEPEPADIHDFTRWRDFWEHSGVFTLASQFGDDGSKSGELEALLHQIDPDMLAQAQKESGGSKSRAGAYFAASHPRTAAGRHWSVQEDHRVPGNRMTPPAGHGTSLASPPSGKQDWPGNIRRQHQSPPVNLRDQAAQLLRYDKQIRDVSYG
jgi:hypothetical protein